MSLSHSPSIVTSGLVLYYDMNNTQKSWKGAPVVNNVSAPDDFNNGTYWDKTTYPIVVTSNTILAPDNTLTGDLIVNNNAAISLILQTISTTIVGTGALICSIYVKAYTASYFTFNCYYQGDTELNPSFYMNGTSDTGTTMTSVGNGWYRCSMTVPARVNAGTSLFFRIWPGGRGLTNNLGFYFWGAQIDTGFLKPYVNGSRTTSTALLDLSGNNTLTANSLTYASNNTFSFNGSSDYISSTVAFTSGQALTVIGWLYSTETTATYRNFFDSITQKPMIWWNTLGQIEFDAALYFTPAVYRNQWVQVALSKPSGSSSASYYVNGVLVGTGTAYTVQAVTPTWFNRAGAQTWLGSCSNVQVYNKELTADQVLQNFNALKGRYL